MEHYAIKSGVERVMYSAIPRGGNHIRLLSLRSTNFILRALGGEAVDLASRTKAARRVICPQLCVRVTLVFCEDENINFFIHAKNAMLCYSILEDHVEQILNVLVISKACFVLQIIV